jgi:DNA helicase-2/ATP-dependent DNA helicase PcrA
MDPLATGRELDQQFRAACARLETERPWFGAFALDTAKRRVAYKVGDRRHPEEYIVDWRHPLAAAFYDGAPGAPFELDAEHYAHLAGTTAYIAKVTSRGAVLARMELRVPGATHTLVAGDDGLVPEDALPRARAAAGALPDIRALLSPAQYALITSSRRRPVILQGRAGSGKTTVALYRVSWLTYAPDDDPGATPVDPSKVLIVMFNAALRSFVQSSLAPLKLERAQIATFHHWALESVRTAYSGELEINPRFEHEGRDVAARLKKQLGMLAALDEFVRTQTKRAGAWLDERLAPYRAASLAAEFRAMRRPVARRFVELKAQALRRRNAAVGAEQARWENVLKVLQQGTARIIQYKEELLRFLTDTELLGRHLAATPAELDALAAYQRALQGDGGTDRRPGKSVSFEDLALLMRLLQLKHGGLPNKNSDDELVVFDHLVVDEAQDFGAVELRVLLDAVRTRTGVTIVGDENQKIVPSADFIGWDALATELGIRGAEVARLHVAHRATAPIMALANVLVGDADTEGREGPTPQMVFADGDASLREAVVAGLKECLAESPQGHHAVVFRWPKHAAAALEWLAPALPDAGVRLGHNASFVFAPGVTVTNLQQVKGLEFDSVTLVDPTEAHYPSDDPQARRNLYTAITRAKERLRLVTAGDPATVLLGAVARGLLAVERVGALAPVAFTAEEEDPF